MFTAKKSIFIVVLFASLFSSTVFSQEVGKIFDRNEADKLYGPVLEKVVINVDELKTLLLSTSDKVMFRLENNKYTILGDRRNLLYYSDKFVESNQVFHMYSKSKVLELIKKGNEKTIALEKRKGVFSISAGNYTLEAALPCPPFCD